MTRAPSRPPLPPRIELVIDEVVWHGGNPSDRRAFAEALERALVHELGHPAIRRALARGGAEIRSLDAGSVPRITGGTVARALTGGIVRAARTRP